MSCFRSQWRICLSFIETMQRWQAHSRLFSLSFRRSEAAAYGTNGCWRTGEIASERNCLRSSSFKGSSSARSGDFLAAVGRRTAALKMVEREGTATWQRLRIEDQNREAEFRGQVRDETEFHHESPCATARNAGWKGCGVGSRRIGT